MTVKSKKSKPQDASTQRYLPFSQIRDNIIIMKDWSARIVLKCSTINFLLKSIEEQDSIIISFQRFLNSIDFPVQIIIRSKKLDIDPYLKKLELIAIKQKNQLLQKQTKEYIEYLKKLIEVADIMKKDFFLVVAADNEDDKSIKDTTFLWLLKNFWAGFNKKDDLVKIKSQIKELQNLKKKLISRVNVVRNSLDSIWIRTMELNKNELIRYLSEYYNPTLSSKQTFKNVDNYNIM